VNVRRLLRQLVGPITASPTSALTFMSPVVRGEEYQLATTIRQVDEADPHPLHGGATHFARFAMVDSLSCGAADAGRKPLRSTYLLFAPAFDGDLDAYLDELGTGPFAPTADAIWGHCVAYPGTASRSLFHDWFWRCRLPSPYVIPGYPGTVSEVRHALAAREAVADLAGRAAELTDDELLTGFGAAVGRLP
jgi:hypothetical protein